MLTMLFLSATACAKGSQESHRTSPIVSDTSLEERREQILEWAVTCHYGDYSYPCEDRPAHKQDEKDDHSMMMAGYVCASGQPGMHEATRAMIAEDGQMFRSVRQRYEGRGDRADNLSRDMAVGALLCWAVTKDQDSLWRTYRYIREHGNKLCDDDSDGRCLMTPVLWRSYEIAFKHAGLSVPPTMKRNAGGSDALYAQVVLFNTPKGYRTLLNATQLHLHDYVGRGTKNLDRAKEFIRKRERLNPYFEYLARGKTDKAKRLVLEQCPTERPEYADEWTWGQDQDKQKWKESIGWDCVFMINLLLG